MGTRVTVLIVAATVSCALGTGLYMQKRADDMRGPGPVAVSAPGTLPSEPDTGKLVLQDLTFTSAAPVVRPSRPDAGAVTDPAAGCPADMTVTPAKDAFLQVEIDAPCHAGERFTLHHSGLMITESLSPAGTYSGQVPAMAAHSVVLADFATGRDLEASARVVDFDRVERVALQWQGHSGLELHALEFGATYGEEGHVWAGSEPGRGAGSVELLGDPDQIAPHLLQVYTLPQSAALGDSDVSVEAEITAMNCDRTISAQLVERRGDHLRTRDLTLNMPDCSAVGDFLVLNNLVESLKIAAN
ncbi:hypothetical protein [Epibacterium sp. Ofav1-8]|uniref:hypothetical protein n=1 Tax=Epibacterium sp. Ofav1-8 TaxID=2917735 RepID=UPI001EF552BE|nr:hypothetical protein [Epibacterium sp. Ofav1-8]MCG7623811.1 hypothetical protein [Epibacterium sp. Ofav1-8]